MFRKSQRELRAGRHPLRLRAAAFFCLLLVAAAGIAQAAHIHGDWLPNAAAQVSAHVSDGSAISEDSCPLCIAMHSALPAATFAAVLLGLVLGTTPLLRLGRTPRSTWHFASFSRPPPLA